MIRTRSWALAFVFLLLAMTLIPFISVTQDQYSPDERAITAFEQRETNNKVHFYMHGNTTDGYLNTNPPTRTQNRNLNMDDSTTTPLPSSVSFETQYEFQSDTTIYGDELDVGGTGIKLYMSATYIGIVGSATIKLKLTSEGQNVASGSGSVSPGSPQNRFELSFSGSGDSYTVSSGNRLKLEVAVNVSTGNGAVLITYDADTDNGRAYLLLKTDLVSSITAKTYDNEGIETKLFEPNLPATDTDGDPLRVIVVKGTAKDRYHRSDIKAIGITATNPSGGTLQDYTRAETEEVDEATLRYEYQWKYPTGLSAGGGYTVTVYVADQKGNNYTQELQFSISEYGVFIGAEESSILGNPGDELTPSIKVYNTGSKSDTITTQVEVQKTVPKGQDWNPGIDTGDGEKGEVETQISKGSYHTYGLSVVVPDDSDDGNQCFIDIISTSTNDEDKQYIFTLVVTVTSYVDFTVALTGPDSKTVSYGGTAQYDVTVKNIGELTDIYTVYAPVVTSGWGVDFTSNDVTLSRNGSGNKYDFNLSEGGEAVISMLTSAPAQSSGSNAIATIECAVKSYGASDIKTVKTITTISDATAEWVYLTPETIEVEVKEEKSGGLEYEAGSTAIKINNPTTSSLTGTASFLNVKDGDGNIVSGDWDVSLSQGQLDIASSKVANVDVSIKPAADTPADKSVGYTVNFKVRIDEFNKDYNLGLKVKIMPYYWITATLLSNENMTIGLEQEAEFSFRIENKGNTQDTATLVATVEEDDKWNVAAEPGVVNIDRGEDKIVTVRVTPKSEEAENGDQGHVSLLVKYGPSDKEKKTEETDLIATYQLSTTEALRKVLWDLILQIVIFLFVVLYAVVATVKISHS